MGFFDGIAKSAGKVGNYLATTGTGALKTIGDGARSIKKLGGAIDSASGGMAGAAFQASKSMPVIGTVTSNVERGLDMAEKYSDLGVKAINLGKKASGVRSVAGAKGVLAEGKALARKARP